MKMKLPLWHQRFGFICVGDVLSYWREHDFGGVLCYARIIKIGFRRIQVRDENGSEYWQYPDYFADVISQTEIRFLRSIGISI